MIRSAILGASGYVGGELMRLLAGHPAIGVVHAFAASNAGQPVAAVHPALALAYPDQRFAAFDAELLGDCDLIFAALPHGETQRLADQLLAPGVPIVDLGADFRLDSADRFERWYGEPHIRPELLPTFTYGLPEFFREEIRKSRRVAAPGCYPTAASLALRPLVAAGAIEPDGIIVDAASGVSGAGRGASAATHYCAVDGNFRPYGLIKHRHTAEMEQIIGAEVLFTPHLMAASRGIVATCYARATGVADPLEILHAQYRDERFVHVGEAPPESKWATGSNAAFLSARYDERTGMMVAMAAIDNLGKGAAGQMLQCANLILGLDEGCGLSNMGIHP